MNKEDHFIDTDKLGDVLLEFSKKISRFSQNIPDTLFGSLTEFLKIYQMMLRIRNFLQTFKN